MTLTIAQAVAESHIGSGNGQPFPSDRPRVHPVPNRHAADPVGFLELRILCESFHDTQQNRMSCTSRMERGGADPDLFAGQIEALNAAELSIERLLVRRYRSLVRSSLPGVDAWQQSERGIGEHLLARLLGHLGHPVIAEPYHWEGSGSDRKLVADAPFYRTASQLRAYCGHGDPARKRRRAMSADDAMALGNPHCKMIVHLLAVGCIRQVPREPTIKRTPPKVATGSNGFPGVCADLSDDPTTIRPSPNSGASVSSETSPEPITDAVRDALGGHSALEDQKKSAVEGYSYRLLYEQRRVATAERLHADDCIRCGPSGKPAAAGTPWSKGHQLADAQRIVGKQILNDLWKAAS